MHGSFKAPYPVTGCSGYIPDCDKLLYLYRNREALKVKRYVNNTKVNGVAPAPMIAPPGNFPSCASPPTTVGQYDGTNNGHVPPPWGKWTMYPFPENSFVESGTIDLGQCPEEGWKAAAARRLFHGCYGLDTAERNDGGCLNVDVLNGDGSVCQSYLTERGNQPAVKYLSCKRTSKGVSTITDTSADPDPGSPTYGEGIVISQTVTYIAEYTVSINPNSGEATISGRTYTENFTVSGPSSRNLTSFYSSPPLGIPSPYDKTDVLLLLGIIDGCSSKFTFTLTGELDLTVFGLGHIWWNSAGYIGRSTPGLATAAQVAYGSAFTMNGNGMFSIGSVTVTGVTDGTKMEFYDGSMVKIGESTCTAYLSAQKRSLKCDASVTDPGGGPYTFTGSIEVGFELSDENLWADVYADMVALAEHYPLNDKLLLKWRKDASFGLVPVVSRNELGVPISPKDTPPGFDVTTGQVDDLTSPINDSGGHTPFSPSWVPTYSQRDWFDPRCYVWEFNPGETSADHAAIGLTKIVDGNILGSPHLKEDGSSDLVDGKIAYGRDKYFDRRFEKWTFCIDVHDVKQYYVESYGDFTPNIFSGAVKQWTNANEEKWLAPGASAGRFFNADLYWTQQNWLVKMAVTMPVGLPAQNLFGAAGPDRFAVDEAKAWCATNITGSVITLDATGTAPAFAANTLVLLCDTGDPLVDGVYQASVTGTWEITLGTRKWDLPTDFTRDHGGSDSPTPFIGVIRFPSAFAIRGRARVKTATQDSSKVILEYGPQTKTAFGEFKYLRDGDMVDCQGIPGLGANLAWERVDDTHGKVTGTLTGDYDGKGFLISHGAPDYEWDTTYPRRTYILNKWLSVWRDFQERDRAITQYTECPTTCPGGDCSVIEPGDTNHIRPLQGGRGLNQSVKSFEYTEACLRFTQCDPAVICISPNGETWPNGITYEFPAASDVVPDELYGGPLWQSVPIVAQTNWMTQTPAKPCVEDVTYSGGWVSDDGTCKTDGVNKYYQAPWLVEPVASLFTGQPSLPAGEYVGWLSISDMNNVSLPDGNITPNPPKGGDSLALPFDWLGNTKACIEAVGRFADIYKTYFE